MKQIDVTIEFMNALLRTIKKGGIAQRKIGVEMSRENEVVFTCVTENSKVNVVIDEAGEISYIYYDGCPGHYISEHFEAYTGSMEHLVDLFYTALPYRKESVN